jgi:hypothetical protein
VSDEDIPSNGSEPTDGAIGSARADNEVTDPGTVTGPGVDHSGGTA